MKETSSGFIKMLVLLYVHTTVQEACKPRSIYTCICVDVCVCSSVNRPNDLKILRRPEMPTSIVGSWGCDILNEMVPIVLQSVMYKVMSYRVLWYAEEWCYSAGTAIYWRTMKLQPASISRDSLHLLSLTLFFPRFENFSPYFHRDYASVRGSWCQCVCVCLCVSMKYFPCF